MLRQQVEAEQQHSDGYGEQPGREVKRAQAQAHTDDHSDDDGERRGRGQHQHHANGARCGYVDQREAAKPGPTHGGGRAEPREQQREWGGQRQRCQQQPGQDGLRWSAG